MLVYGASASVAAMRSPTKTEVGIEMLPRLDVLALPISPNLGVRVVHIERDVGGDERINFGLLDHAFWNASHLEVDDAPFLEFFAFE